ncbi:MAG: hypothetical protein ACYDDF_13140 [Thermoplasmatota archaeon]
MQKGGAGALAIAALVLMSVSRAVGAADAAVLIDSDSTAATAAVMPGANVTGVVPFHLDEAGDLYVKLLATPWNAIDNGTPNGTVTANHSSGVRGWWVGYELADDAGRPLTKDANNASINPFLGFYADTQSTRLVPLSPNQPYDLLLSVHVSNTATAGSQNHVVIALAFRNEASATGNGAFLDQSRGFTLTVPLVGNASLSGRGGPTGGNPSQGSVGGSSNPAETATKAVAGSQSSGSPGTGSGTSGASSSPSSLATGASTITPFGIDMSSLALVVGGFSFLALVVSAVAITIASYTFMLLTREIRGLREELRSVGRPPTPEDSTRPPKSGESVQEALGPPDSDSAGPQ